MATESRNDDQMLNAMVDGELAPAEQAAMAARLASERDLARAYATLSKLKASVIESAGMSKEVEVRLPEQSRRIRTVAGTAAVAAAFAIAVAFVGFLDRSRENPKMADPATPAVSQHVQLAAFPIEPVIPDLVPAGLRLAKTIVSADAKSPVVVATYLGPRGCRLELTVRSGDPIATSAAGTDRRKWRVGGLTYELVAYGMPAARFSIVAEAAERATRATSQPDVINGRLREARLSPLPCIA